jgi:xylulokinase
VLEGVAFGLRDNFELLNNLGLPRPSEVRLSGGGARSSVWQQMIADVVGVELVNVEITEGAALGAAILAGVGAEVWQSVDIACDRVVRPTTSTKPSTRNHDNYGVHYRRFRELYPPLKGFFETDVS